MLSLRSLTEDLEAGDNLAWVAEKSMGDTERVTSKEVIEVRTQENTIRVIGEGINGGIYYYTIDSNGKTEAFVGHPEDDYPEFRGSVAFAQRTESQDMIEIMPRAYDRD